MRLRRLTIGLGLALAFAIGAPSPASAAPCDDIPADFRCYFAYDLIASETSDLSAAAATTMSEAAPAAGDASTGAPEPPLIPDLPTLLPELGLNDSRSTPISTDDFLATNNWVGILNGSYVQVWAGVSPVDYETGALLYTVWDSTASEMQHYTLITAPTRQGPLSITGVTNGVLSLASSVASNLRYTLGDTLLRIA